MTNKAEHSSDITTELHNYQRSARCWNPAVHPRVYALTLAALGETQLAQGHIDAACAIWSRALDGMNGVSGSARVRKTVADIRGHLAAFRRKGVADAMTLDARAASWQTGHIPRNR
ncbi:hypothetical protein GCM10010390_53640 [Streptomyces mordarskii]|uniref:Uncharacterized protein n=1 Tax=Streptomyces mordarskii TaxID=1226758 RepID=A0ABN1DIW7_9ACTN